jgi:hypothetical protein
MICTRLSRKCVSIRFWFLGASETASPSEVAVLLRLPDERKALSFRVRKLLELLFPARSFLLDLDPDDDLHQAIAQVCEYSFLVFGC